jgi:hypothetical protein
MARKEKFLKTVSQTISKAHTELGNLCISIRQMRRSYWIDGAFSRVPTGLVPRLKQPYHKSYFRT